MLIGSGEAADRVAGLDAGADDYLTRPFDLAEAVARVRALLRRGSNSLEGSGGSSTLTVGDLVVDRRGRTVTCGGEVISFTKTEFDLLELLALNAGAVLSRDTIYEQVWGYNFETGSNSLDVYIGYLRRKLEADGRSRLLHTVRGSGYVLRESP